MWIIHFIGKEKKNKNIRKVVSTATVKIFLPWKINSHHIVYNTLIYLFTIECTYTIYTRKNVFQSIESYMGTILFWHSKKYNKKYWKYVRSIFFFYFNHFMRIIHANVIDSALLLSFRFFIWKLKNLQKKIKEFKAMKKNVPLFTAKIMFEFWARYYFEGLHGNIFFYN